MQHPWAILGINWLAQGARGMDWGERAARWSAEVFLVSALSVLAAFGGAPWPVALLLGALVGHSLFFALNGQLWVCLRYGPRYHGDVARLRRWVAAYEARLRATPYLDEAVFLGSAAGGRLGPRSDLDLRLIAPPTLFGFVRAHFFAAILRFEAAMRRAPLDLYVYDRIDSLRRHDAAEAIWIVLDRKGRLARHYAEGDPPRRSSPPPIEREIEPDPPSIHCERAKVCLAYSPGGHRAELERALSAVRFDDVFHVTFENGLAPPSGERVYFIAHPRRSPARALLNLAQSFVLLRRERPSWVISTGADVAFGPLFVGWALGARTLFIETAGGLDPSLTGRMVHPFVERFLVVWPEKRRAFPRAELANGPPW